MAEWTRHPRTRSHITTALLLSGLCMLVPLAAHEIAAAQAPIPRGAEAHPHDDASCANCHSLEASAQDPGALASMRSARCSDCHGLSPGGSALAAIFHAGGRRSCLDCHDFHAPKIIKARNASFVAAIGNEAAHAHCASCHDGTAGFFELSEGHRQAARIYHIDGARLAGTSPSQGCLRCHSRSAGMVLGIAAASDAPAFEEAATHPYGVRVVGADAAFALQAPSDPRVRMFARKIECQTCHDITGTADDLLISFENPYELCVQCHRRGSDDPDDPDRLASTH